MTSKESIDTIAPRHSSARVIRLAFGHWAICALRFVILARHRHRSRLALSRLEENGLRDIGLTPDAARRECEKPFWR